MIVKAINIDTGEIIFQSNNGMDVIKKAEASSQDYILDFEETLEENLLRKTWF